MRPRIPIFWMTALLGLAGCGSPPKEEAKAPPPAPVVEERVDPRPVVVALGDSLTAGYGVEPGLSYPDWLQKRMDSEGVGYRVVNQGISGDTTSGGVARIEEALRLKPAVVVLALGANDGLRGLPLEATRANLAEMIGRLQAGGARVLLGGMTLPRNYGPDYVRDFENVFKELAKEKKTGLIPFLLDGVAMNPQFMQGDALHPTAEGNRRVAETVWRYLRPMLPPAPASA
jgi:acyl-CoA thioesterase I